MTLQPVRPTSIALEDARTMIRFTTFMAQNPIAGSLSSTRSAAGTLKFSGAVLKFGDLPQDGPE